LLSALQQTVEVLVFNADNPLAAGSTWLSFYGLSRPVANLNRITVDGSSNAGGPARLVEPTANSRGSQEL
jgi:hypothetical protein